MLHDEMMKWAINQSTNQFTFLVVTTHQGSQKTMRDPVTKDIIVAQQGPQYSAFWTAKEACVPRESRAGH